MNESESLKRFTNFSYTKITRNNENTGKAEDKLYFLLFNQRLANDIISYSSNSSTYANVKCDSYYKHMFSKKYQ